MTAVVLIILVIFAIRVVAGIIVVVSLGVRREDDGPFLPETGPDQLTRGGGRLTGLYVRQAPARDRVRVDRDLFV